MRKYKTKLKDNDKVYKKRELNYHAKDFKHAVNIADLARCDNERIWRIREVNNEQDKKRRA